MPRSMRCRRCANTSPRCRRSRGSTGQPAARRNGSGSARCTIASTPPIALPAPTSRFREAGGATLADYASFAARDHGDDDPGLHLFAQWLAQRSWGGLQREARERGMGIGLIADLAVGFDPAGAEAAAWPQATLSGLVLGAPPDAFNPAGQVWGIGSYSPRGLRESGYAPFIALLRAVLHDRGGLRIDHILGLLRLWLVPAGAGPGEGGYVRYPLPDLLNLLVLESWRHRAIVIGEDLGVVPPGFRDTLAARGVLGTDVLLFNRDPDGRFLAAGTLARTSGGHDHHPRPAHPLRLARGA